MGFLTPEMLQKILKKMTHDMMLRRRLSSVVLTIERWGGGVEDDARCQTSVMDDRMCQAIKTFRAICHFFYLIQEDFISVCRLRNENLT